MVALAMRSAEKQTLTQEQKYNIDKKDDKSFLLITPQRIKS